MVAAVPGLSTRQQADVVAALMALHRRLAGCGSSSRAGRPNGATRTPRAMSPMSATTAEAVATPPAPGPDQRDRRDAVGVDGHGVGDAHHLRDRGVLRHHGRMHALLDALVGAAPRRRAA